MDYFHVDFDDDDDENGNTIELTMTAVDEEDLTHDDLVHVCEINRRRVYYRKIWSIHSVKETQYRRLMAYTVNLFIQKQYIY